MNTEYITETLPPHNVEAEQAVLGAIIIDPDAIHEAAEVLTPDSFYRPAHGWLFEAMQRLAGRQEPIDVVSLEEELRRMGKVELVGGMDFLIDLTNAVITSVNAQAYAGIVADTSTRRRLLAVSSDIAKKAYDEKIPIGDVLAAAEAGVLAIGGAATGNTVEGPRRYMSDYIEAFMADVVSTDSPRVVNSGLVDFDRILGGFERGHQYIVAGATSMGKSSFALGVALHAALRQDKRVLVFSLEMSKEQLGNRFISMMTGIPVESLKAQNRRHLSIEQQTRVMNASGKLSDSRLFMDCSSGIRPSDVRSRAARAYAEHGLDLIIVDHMHIMAANNPTGNDVKDLGSIAMDLATVYKQLNVAGITVAQINREVEKRATKIPGLSDLRASGQIEENAYVVIFLHRAAYYEPETANPNVARIVVAKNRDGATGSTEVFWKPEVAVFKDLVKKDVYL